MKESKLLTGVFNRLGRSVLYEAKKNFDCTVPLDDPAPAAVSLAWAALSDVDAAMKRTELHTVMAVADRFLRDANKRWADGISAAESTGDDAARRQVLTDAAYLLWVGTLIMHPIVPRGCEDICEKLCFDPTRFFSWDHDFSTLAEIDDGGGNDHAVAELPSRYDFFKAHPTQA